jgi:hypothetical protein
MDTVSFQYPNFVVAPLSLVADEFDNYNYIAVLSSISCWTNQYAELLEWCDLHSCTVEGMTVRIPNDQTLTMFVLRWA